MHCFKLFGLPQFAQAVVLGLSRRLTETPSSRSTLGLCGTGALTIFWPFFKLLGILLLSSSKSGDRGTINCLLPVATEALEFSAARMAR